MCRNIKPLFNFDPPAKKAEVHEAALQYVRKISGYNSPSEINQHAFDEAIEEISQATAHLLSHLKTHAEPRNREVEAKKAHSRAIKRFGKQN